MSQKPQVLFLYRAGHASTGSKIMRCDQLCEMATQHLGERFDFATQALPRPNQLRAQRRLVTELEGKIVIFLKRADQAVDPDILADLRQTVRGMAIDYVDGTVNPLPVVPMDVHISASITGAQVVNTLLSGPFDAPLNDKTVSLTVLHHADPRITAHKAPMDRLRLGYIGRPDNAFLPDVVRDYMPEQSHTDDFLEQMASLNVHYCVRQIDRVDKKLRVKPFTKGFNAAASHALAMVNRQVPDAEAFLGDDYLLMINDASEPAVAAGLSRAQEALGSPEWDDALDRMAALRARIAPARITAQLERAIEVML